MRFQKKNRLTRPSDIRAVFKSPKRVRAAEFTLRWQPADFSQHKGSAGNETGGSRFCVTVTKGVVKTAVKRNRIKRLVKEFFRLNMQNLSQVADVVVQVNECKEFKYKEIDKILKLLFQKAGLFR